MKLLYPTRSPHITQPYGAKSSSYADYHHGTDFRTWNDPKKQILAAANGEVVFVDTSTTCNKIYDKSCSGSSYGMHIIIKHNEGGQVVYTLYGHLSRVEVEKGDKVKMGQLIGTGGNTGYSSAEHLHFEVRLGNNLRSSAINPKPFFVTESIPNWGRKSWKWAQKHDILSKFSEFDRVPTTGELIEFMHRLSVKEMEWTDNKIELCNNI